MRTERTCRGGVHAAQHYHAFGNRKMIDRFHIGGVGLVIARFKSDEEGLAQSAQVGNRSSDYLEAVHLHRFQAGTALEAVEKTFLRCYGHAGDCQAGFSITKQRDQVYQCRLDRHILQGHDNNHIVPLVSYYSARQNKINTHVIVVLEFESF